MRKRTRNSMLKAVSFLLIMLLVLADGNIASTVQANAEPPFESVGLESVEPMTTESVGFDDFPFESFMWDDTLPYIPRGGLQRDMDEILKSAIIPPYQTPGFSAFGRAPAIIVDPILDDIFEDEEMKEEVVISEDDLIIPDLEMSEVEAMTPNEIGNLLTYSLIPDQNHILLPEFGITTTPAALEAANPSTLANARNARGQVIVRYNGNGNTGGTVPAAQTVTTPGDVILAPQGNMVRTGHVFRGWRNSAGNVLPPGIRVVFDTPVSGTLDLTAHWEPAVVTIEYRSIGHTGGLVPAPQRINTPGQVALVGPGTLTRTGYVFGGWRASSGDVFAPGQILNFDATMSGTFVLQAHWIRPRVTITYRSTGHTGGVAPASQELITPGSIRLRPQGSLTRSGHILAAWRTSTGVLYPVDGVINFGTAVAGTLALEAHWVPSVVTIEYMSIGHTSGTPPANQLVTTPGTATLRNQGTLRRAGYAFVGWRTTGGDIFRPNQRVAFGTATAGTMPLLAQWVPVIRMNYTNLTNSTAMIAEANEFVNAVKPAFMDTFGIELVRQTSGGSSALNQRAGCERIHRPHDYCNYTCGVSRIGADCGTHHHRSGNHLLNVNPGSRSTAVFRFVDFRLCSFRGSNANPTHIRVNGLAWINGNDIIVTSRSDNARRTTAHEISHLFGVLDGGCSDVNCVMTPAARTYNQWCDVHWAQLQSGRNR